MSSDSTRPFAHRSMPDDIAALLREEILDGVQAPDAPLRQEQLARRFGTNQAPIREAFRRLEAEGLVVAVAQRGVRVASLSVPEAEEMGSLRLVLEPPLTARAADRAKEVDAAAARAAIEAMAQAETPAALMVANAEFYDAIYTAAIRPITLEVVAGLRARYERYMRRMWHVTGLEALSTEEHFEILDLVLAGDAAAVQALMERHISGATAQIVTVLQGAKAG